MRKTLKQKIDESLSEITEMQKKHDALLKQFKEQEDKARTHRLCRRGGYVEKHIPELIPLTDKQFYTFVEKTMESQFSKKILAELTAENEPSAESTSGNTTAQNGANAVPQPTEAAAQDNPAPVQKPAGAPQGGVTSGNTSGSNAAPRTN